MRAVLAIVLLLAVVGCGGEDSLTRGEWAAQANAICLEALKKVEALGRPVTSDDYLRVTPKANEIGRVAIEKLRELKAPEAIEQDAKAMSDGYENVVRLQDIEYRGMKAQRAGTEAPRDYWRAGNRAVEAGRAADEIAKRLRATDCARDPWQAPSQT
jgi:Tfp pilus assembly protein PilP